MEDNETFQQLKLMSQKPKISRSIIVAIIGFSIVVLVLSSGDLNSCGIRHIALLEDIKTFEDNGDPEFCTMTVDKILEFNEECEPYIEILDCG